MKAGLKRLVVVIVLLLPYLAFLMYRVKAHQENPLPAWAWYVGLAYFFGAIALSGVLRNGIRQDEDTQETEKHPASKWARLLGYIFLLGPASYLVSGGLKRQPSLTELVGFAWACVLSGACFYIARKIDKDSQRTAA